MRHNDSQIFTALQDNGKLDNSAALLCRMMNVHKMFKYPYRIAVSAILCWLFIL